MHHPMPDRSDMINFTQALLVLKQHIFGGIKKGSAPNIETYVARFLEVSMLPQNK
jgi:hypothetical protein